MKRTSTRLALTFVALSTLTSSPTSAQAEPPVVRVSPPVWQVPSAGLPADLPLEAANNNVGIEAFEGRLFMAWRTAPNHFASKKTRLIVVSSVDLGKTWEKETEVALATDIREPYLFAFRGQLSLSYFEAGSNPLKFEPKHLLRRVRRSQGDWGAPEEWGVPGEIAWEIKARNGRAWATTYIGNHYAAGSGKVEVHFKVSDDGIHWDDVNATGEPVYVGGVSEVGFDFDAAGNLYAVGRNEDGDESGFGSLVFTAPANDLGHWTAPKKSNPNRYDSPRMFRDRGNLYLVARRDLGKPFGNLDRWMPFGLRKWTALARYSLSPKRTALYRVNPETRTVEWIVDLPSAGDNAFPSIVQMDAHRFLVANYTSPPEHTRWSWIEGQTNRAGTQIYFTTLDF